MHLGLTITSEAQRRNRAATIAEITYAVLDIVVPLYATDLQ
jgi:hypothetical protein